MRYRIKHIITCSVIAAVFQAFYPAGSMSGQGIETYYIHLDVHTIRHKVTKLRISMAPAERPFKASPFSMVPVSGIIAAPSNTSQSRLADLGRKDVFARILEQQGLKSLASTNFDTIVRYDGLIQTPINLQIHPYDNNLNGYPYTGQICFAPLKFPDQWGKMERSFKTKEIIDDFILFFK